MMSEKPHYFFRLAIRTLATNIAVNSPASFAIGET